MANDKHEDTSACFRSRYVFYYCARVEQPLAVAVRTLNLSSLCAFTLRPCSEVAIAEPKKRKAKPSADGVLGGDEDNQQQQEGRAGAPPPVVAVKIKAKRKKCV